MRPYLREFALNWHTLLGCSLGMALGSAISHYTLSLLGPAMMAEFAWSKAQFALIGSITLLTMPLIPLAGRFTDKVGPRIAAIVGFTAVPLGFLAYTTITGSIVQFFAIYLLQHVFGVLTTSLVFCRVIVERYDVARGIALSLLMTGPPLVGAIATPILGWVIGEWGWRAGWISLSGLSALGGLAAVSLMGRTPRSAGPRREKVQLSRAELFALLRHPAFLLIFFGMVLVNLPQVFASSQLKLVVIDNGVSAEAATWMISLYAVGVIAGRFACGLALDRLPTHVVAIAALLLPAVGFMILASPTTVTLLLSLAVLIVGVAQGAEGDIGAYLISRQFDMKNYSLLLSLLTAAIGLGAALGSLFLSFTLHRTDSYDPFLLLAAGGTVLGATLFFLTGRVASGRPSNAPEYSS
jgi:predicted MFS family arabinose efflux permease